MALVLSALAAVSSFAAPFAQKIPFTQPDGTQIELWGEGDEFYAVFESLDGYTVVFDPATKAYHYAKTSPDGSALLPTGSLVGKDNPAALGLAKHQRITPDAVKTQAQQRFQVWDQGMNISQRWTSLKASRQVVGMGVNGDIAMAPPSSTTAGTKVGLTLLVDFSDDVATIPQTNINNYCNADSYTGYGNNGSVKQYFWDVSNGTLLYTNVVTVYIRAPQPKSYYNVTTNDAGAQANILIRDVIGVMTNLPNYQTEILPQFEGLTVNGSTNVIACNVFYAGGNGGVWSKGLWPHSWSLYNVGAQPLSPGGKKVYRYQITNIGTSLALGTFCHENGHMLCGFPDIYDYDYNSRGGAGVFCLMNSGGSGGNPVQVCGYLKRAAGWAITTELTASMADTISVGSSGEEFNHFYRYSKPGVTTEYFLIENRQKSGRDANISASGIAIWHIDELGNKDNQSLTPNSSHLNYECTLVQADNLWHFQRNSNSGDANDLYYSGNTATAYKNEFTDYSSPGARWWDGSLSGIRLRGFSAIGSTMTLTVGETLSAENSVTNTIAAGTTSAAGAYTLGTNGSFNTLIITNGGVLTVTNGGAISTTNGLIVMSLLGDGVIGGSSVSSNNFAVVTGAGSLWSNRNALYVGAFGSSNSLAIAEGGCALNTTGYVGYDSAAANNSAQVTGAGSIWSNSGSLYVGYLGSSNSMTVASGAQVFNSNAYVGANAGANENAVWVSDAGSLWQSRTNLYVGDKGSGNALTIANAGRVGNAAGYVGNNTNAGNNAVLVTGAGSTWSNSSSLYVGYSGSGNSLTIANSGRVNNTIGYIGVTSSARNNSVLVTDLGSVWSNSSTLHVGYYGMSNNLTVADGGRVLNASGYVGYYGSNGFVLVTGGGSLWSNSSSLAIGSFGTNNLLTIADGGRVLNGIGYIGLNSSANNNAAVVTGDGSVWSNSSFFYVGASSAGNRLTITNGGRVFSAASYVGNSSNNNSALITGAGSLWKDNGSLYVGYVSFNNSLTIANSGQVLSASCTVGNNASATNNSVLVADDGVLRSTNGTLTVGYYGRFNNVVVTNGGQMFSVLGTVGSQTGSVNNAVLVSGSGSIWSNTGTINMGSAGGLNRMTISAGGTVMTATGIVGNGSTSSNNTVLVTDFGSGWSNLSLTIGGSGMGNSLVITNNGIVTARSFSSLGAGSGSSNNSVLVTGAGSVWNAGTNLYVGNSGSGNSLAITNGGRVTDVTGYIGYNATAKKNAAVVTDPDSVWSNNGNLYVGNFGPDNSLVISNGGRVFNGIGYVSLSSSSSNNSVRVTGPGSLWSNSSTLWMGSLGPSNTLIISNGGRVVVNGATIGNATVAANNLAVVTGAGSLWTNSSNLTIGNSSSNNRLMIADGGRVLDGVGTLGYYASASNNTVWVSDAGSVWNNSGNLYIGVSGAFNRLTIANGGQVGNAAGSIGSAVSAVSNSVLVTDAGSLWTNSGDLYIGSTGSFNQLTVTNVGRVANNNSYIGFNANAANNSVLVTGAGSVWNTGSNLYVGNSGSGNSLAITNGGRVINGVIWSASGYIGYNTSASNNSVLVTDAGSVWTNNGDLSVGYSGRGNSMTIASGGTVLNNYGRIGYNSTASNNSVLVTDPGSLWSNANGSVFYVGMYGSSNSLAIANSGRVASYWGFIGWAPSASNNSASVTGAGSVWNNSSTPLGIGNFGSGNRLTIADGGRVLNSRGTIGNFAVASNNAVLVTGPGSLWSNSSSLVIGASGSFNSLTIASGGQVFGANGVIGAAVSGGNNAVLVDGVGSLWRHNGNLFVGATGSFNQLTVTNGGRVVDANSFVGYDASASNNSVLVTGAGSVWTNSGALTIGGGSGNRVTLTDGGTIYASVLSNLNGSVFSMFDGSLTAPVMLNAGQFIMTGGTLTVAGAFTNAAGGAFNLSGGSVLVPLEMNNMGAFSQTGGFFDPAVFTNSGSFTLSGGTNIAEIFLNLLSGIVEQSGGEHDVNYATNFGSWTISGGVANLTNLFIESGGVFTNSGGSAYFSQATNDGYWTVTDTGLIEIRNHLAVGATGALTNRDGGNVRLVSNATVNVSGSFVITNATLEFAGTSIGSTPFLPGVTFQNGAGVKWSGYGGDFGDHAITGNLNLDLPSGPGLSRGIVDNARLAVGGDGLLYAGSNNLVSLTLTNGAQVLDSVGYIAFDAAASNSSALVSGPGSVWSNSESLFVGYHGSLAALTLTDDGTISASNIVVGFDSSSTGNVLTVNGGRLYATNADGGGALDVRYGALTFNSGTVTVDRLLLTNGLNSVFNFNGGVLSAAEMLSAQPVTVNGGTLMLADSFVNLSESTFELNSGSVIVPNVGVNLGTFIQNGGLFDPLVFTNSGSWTLTGGTNVDVVFLNEATGVMLQTGGEHDVNVATNLGVWTVSGGVANLTNLVIDGGGVFTNTGGALVSTNAAGLGGVDVLNGSFAFNGGSIDADRFIVTNNTSTATNSLFNFNAGTLTTRGAMIMAPKSNNFVIGATPGQTGTWNVLGGTNIVRQVSGSSSNTILGGVAGAVGIVNVSGAGTVWSNSLDVWVGGDGGGSRLTISDGAHVVNQDGLIGMGLGASSNFVLVSGSETVWSNASVLYPGYNAPYNQMVVSNGATVMSLAGYIGRQVESFSNLVLITGAGSLWTNEDFLCVGRDGGYNALLITNGGRVVNSYGYVGVGTSASNNTVVVAGSGSVWMNTNDLHIGQRSPGNSLTITDGAQVFNQTGYVGNAVGADSNSVLVTGSGSAWNTASNLFIGNSGSGNSLVITNGGWVSDYRASIGSAIGANNNSAMVTGTNSVWSNSFTVTVGSFGSMNSLTITNGGKVFGMHGDIGHYQESSNNWAVVTGSGSLWSNLQQLYVGAFGSNNSLTIADGAWALSGDGAVGVYAGNGGNSALVTGPGSLWSNRTLLQIGREGSNNNLTVSNGGQVIDTLGIIGRLVSSSNNSVMVTDAGSLWNNTAGLYVGNSGSFNNLTVANGGMVMASNAVIGMYSPSVSNTVTVSGGSLIVTNITANGALDIRRGTLILNGGNITADVLLLTNNTAGATNSVFNFNAGALTTRSGSSIIMPYGTDFVIGATSDETATWNILGGTNTITNLVQNSNSRQVILGGVAGAVGIVNVSGPGTVWSNSYNLRVGNVSSSNQMTITGGAFVGNGSGFLGYTADSDNNSVLVSDPGSVWSNRGYYTYGGTFYYAALRVGRFGASNSLTISNGGTVWAGGTGLVIGAETGSVDNIVTVNGGSLFVTNYPFSTGGLLDVRRGSLTINSGTVVVMSLNATNGATSIVNMNGGSLTAPVLLNAGQFTMTGGTLTVAGAFTNAVGGTFNLSGGSVLVPLEMNNMGTFIQSGGLFDPAVFTNSGSFTLSGGTNIAEVFLNLLSGVVEQSGGQHDVGYATNFGSWIVSGGVANLTNFIGEDQSTLTVSGGTLHGALTIGNTGSFNQLTVTNGGTIFSDGNGYLGYQFDSSNNTALITGIGSLWSNSGGVYIGNSGTNNMLVISNGGQLINTDGVIGRNDGGFNLGLVTGANSLWTSHGNLHVGSTSPSNTLIVADGAQVVADATAYVGLNGYGNNLLISNGGQVLSASGGVVGRNGGNNSALVTDPGSVWSNGAAFHVGYTGSFNHLTISNGGHVLSAWGGTLGREGNNNSALVADPGSVWSNSGDFHVGYTGSFNQLTISGGGRVVDDAYTYIGYTTGANHNAVSVTGTNSFLSSALNLHVGLYGSMNSMTITNGGQVTNRYGYIGYYQEANNNSVLVTGPGSLWINHRDLNVGRDGASNSLTVADGGAVIASNVFVGANAVSSNNLVTVSGGSLFITNAAGNGTLDIRRGTLTLNSGTIVVDRLIATNFASSVESFNGGTLHSGGSAVNDDSIFQVGNGTSAATLHLLGGTHSFANSLFINTNASLTGTGAITGVITNAGTIAPGDSAGILTGSSDLTLLDNSLLTMQLGGTNSWLYDQINLAGALNFDGTFTLSLLDGFTVSAGNRFDLFDFSSSSGTFSFTNLPGLDPLMYWDTSTLYSSGEIEADWMTGSLQVTLAPAAAVSAGAQWQVDGGAWQNNGDTVSGLVIGDHTLAFKDVEGWVKPTNRVVQVAFDETTVTNGSYELTPVLLAAASRKTHSAAGAFDLALNLNPAVNPTVEPRKNGPTLVQFTFNKEMTATDGVLDTSEFTLTNATYVSATIVSSNLTLNLTNVVDQSKVTVVLNGLSDLFGNALVGTNAVSIRALYGDANLSGTVNIADMQAIKFKLNSALSATNFIYDLNLSGAINIADMQAAKSLLSHTVPLGDPNPGAPTLQFSTTPTLSLPAATLGEALGAPELVWSTDGDDEWTPAMAPDGSSAAWSGSIGDLNVSWVETTVTGPGTVSFEWKVSSEADADYLTFSVDGVDQPGRISGEVDWQTLAFTIPSGTHRLTWTYAKNRANAYGLDAGWLKNVRYQRSP